jgi:hypothetical protein
MLKGTVQGNDDSDFFKEADDGTPYDQVFDDIMSSALNENTLSFVESLSDSFTKYGRLTIRQHEKLMEIWKQAMGG